MRENNVAADQEATTFKLTQRLADARLAIAVAERAVTPSRLGRLDDEVAEAAMHALDSAAFYSRLITSVVTGCDREFGQGLAAEHEAVAKTGVS